MKRFLALMVLAMCATMVGCAIMPPGAEYSYGNQPSLYPDDSSGIIYFMRENNFTGGGAGWFISEEDKKIGVVKSGSYFIYKASAGKHSYLVDDNASSVITIDVQSGEKYYILSWVTVPVIAGTATFHQKEIPASVANRLLPKLQYIHTTFTN